MPTARPISSTTEVACTVTPDRRGGDGGQDRDRGQPTSAIRNDSSSARCRSRSTVSSIAVLMLASPVSAI